MKSDTSKTILKAYEFLLTKEKNKESFSINEIAEATGWKEATVKTYINKQWKKFISKSKVGYSCSGLSTITELDFIKINSQKIKYEALHFRGDNILAYKARNFALLAVATYNNPFSEFRIYGYIVHMIIAWTSLLHAVFQKENKSFFYIDEKTKMTKKRDGEDMAWELSHCIYEYWQGINDPIKCNLNFLIGLRNKIEHRMLPALDAQVAGHCQSCLSNFEELLIQKFGDEYALGTNLAIALQLTKLSENSQAKAMKQLQTSEYSLIKNYMDSFENELSDEILKSEKYRLRIFLTPKPSNHKTSADFSLEFVKHDTENPINSVKCVELLKEKTKIVEKLEHHLKPKKVVEIVAKKLHKKFNINDHTNAWKIYEIRTSSKRTKCIEVYVKWSDITDSYLYSDEWVNFLVDKLKDPQEYKRIVKNS